jgi:pimeloyl-ACP methyl ester carboxylesterase
MEDKKMINPTIHERRGCQLAYRIMGDGDPVIFIQGVGVPGDGWLPQTSDLSDEHCCLRFDNRGMGDSLPIGPDELTVEAMAEDALALMDQQGWETCHVVGHSLGGHIALALAIMAPSRVRTLSLLGCSARGRDMPPLSLRFIWMALRANIGTKRSRRHAFLEMIMPHRMLREGNRDDWAKRMEGIFGRDLATTPPIVLKQARADRAFDASPHFDGISHIPTIVISGQDDIIGPPHLGRTLAKGLSASYQEIAAAAHGLTVTHAAEINELLRGHFSSIEKGPSNSNS